MTIEAWLTWYRSLPGHTVVILYDTRDDRAFWAARDAAGKLIDWWPLDQMGIIRDICDPLTPPMERPALPG